MDLDLCGRRERKKRETRDALEAAALRLFDRRGYDETTVEDICNEVDVSTRTFNRYFPRKEDVLFCGHEDDLAAFRRALAELPVEDGVLRPIRDTIKAQLLSRRGRRDLDLIWARLVTEQPALRAQHLARHEQFGTAIAEFVAHRLGMTPAEDPRPELLGGCCTVIVDTAIRRMLADPDQDEEALLDLLFDTLTGDFELRPAPAAIEGQPAPEIVPPARSFGAG